MRVSSGGPSSGRFPRPEEANGTEPTPRRAETPREAAELAREVVRRSWGEGQAEGAPQAPQAPGWGGGPSPRLVAAYRQAMTRAIAERAAQDARGPGEERGLPRFGAEPREMRRGFGGAEAEAGRGYGPEAAQEEGAAPLQEPGAASGRPSAGPAPGESFTGYLGRLREEAYGRPRLAPDFASRAIDDGVRAAGGGESADDLEAGEMEEPWPRYRGIPERAAPESAPANGQAQQAGAPAAPVGPGSRQTTSESGLPPIPEPPQGSLAAHLKRLREEVYNGGTHPSDAGQGAQQAPAPQQTQAAAPAAPRPPSAPPVPEQPSVPQPDPARWAASAYAPQEQPQPQPAPEQRRSPLMELANAVAAPFFNAKSAFFGGLSALFGGGQNGQQQPFGRQDPRAASVQRNGQEMRQEAGQLLEPAPTHQLNT